MKKEKEQKLDRPIHIERNFTISDGDDKTIAHVNVYERMMGLWVTNLWVQKDLRGQGIGRKLMEAVIRELGDRDLYLNVWNYAGDTVRNDDLVKFYESLGFSMTAVLGVMWRRGRKDG